MKNHNGMRPQDIVVLLKINARDNKLWLMKDLAYELGISASEVTESLNRSVLAGLLAADKKTILRSALLKFLVQGLKYVFPQKPGAMVRGMATAHSAFPLNQQINSDEKYVWTWADGEDRGFAIETITRVAKALLMLVDQIFFWVGLIMEEYISANPIHIYICGKGTEMSV